MDNVDWDQWHKQEDENNELCPWIDREEDQ